MPHFIRKSSCWYVKRFKNDAKVIFLHKNKKLIEIKLYFCRKFEGLKVQLFVYMRKGVLFIVLIMVISAICFSSAGCSDKKTAYSDSIAREDTISRDTIPADTMDNIISETPMPKSAEGLFDDFFFNFAANRKLQMGRIKFPLPVIYRDTTEMITASQWRIEHFFMNQDYYTLIFDDRQQMGVVKDTTIGHVVLEKIFLNKHYVKKYVFDRIRGQWFMTSIRMEGFEKNRNASFLSFYRNFANDTTFQVKSINDPLDFTGPSPIDEFENMDGFLAPEQWLSFAPELPRGLIYNILYDDQKRGNVNQKLFVIRGISNGQEVELTFRKKEGNWKLVKLNM